MEIFVKLYDISLTNERLLFFVVQTFDNSFNDILILGSFCNGDEHDDEIGDEDADEEDNEDDDDDDEDDDDDDEHDIDDVINVVLDNSVVIAFL
ncbi:hypothetical protein DERF_002262 [Dermatophagoides farinae]|uniref:Uncharacterized protein n=1 Tax=Dermatophagoides farinae TaxID=6954 RepID=A0A922LD95_DERFA|nr:hypothetical protein DERF_002262 [Dermatophagoides farinae]